MNRLLAIFMLAVLTSACALQGAHPDLSAQDKITPDSLLESSPLNKTEIDFSDFDMLQMSPEMIAFLDREVMGFDSQSEQLRRLAWAIMRSGSFSLVYEDSTGTASETFASRRGNCMAFTNMFVAMSRYLGIDARYQEVDVPPNWSMSGGSFLYSQHINVYVDLKNGRFREVDFNIYDFDHEMETRVVSDERARAHYFNNVGAEVMLEGETALAYAYLKQSLLEDRDYVPAWINLGILHRREGYPAYAEVAFLEALQNDKREPINTREQTFDIGWMSPLHAETSMVTMSNLANLYEEEGRSDLADKYFAKVESHRMKNPYYRYQMAELAFEEGDYEAAIDDLKYAIRRRKNEDKFYYLLSLSYMMQGDRSEARDWMQKAEEVAQLNSEKEKYSYKLEMLQNMDNP
jgi:tetratricopeptide (TPR) repeat protein